MPYKPLRDKFFDQLIAFYDNGTLPDVSSTDFNFYLQEHAERLKNKGLKLKKEIRKINEDDLNSCISREKPPYHYNMLFKDCDYRTTFYKDDNVVGKTGRGKDVLYAYILDRDQHIDETYTCPNCGHVAPVGSFSNGCPMCGTSFRMKQTYPCVTGFYTYPNLSANSEFRVIIIATIVAAVITATVSGIMTGRNIYTEGNPLWAGVLIGVLGGFFFGLLSGLVYYLFFSMLFLYYFMAKLIGTGVKTMSLGAARFTKKKMEREMSVYDKEFSYELFEGKMISLFRSVVYAENRSDLSVITAKEDLSYMDDIVDLDYRGSMKYNGLKVNNGYLHVNVSIYIATTYYLEDKLTTKNEFYTLEVAKKMDAVEDYGFSIHAVNCGNCAGTFDAMHLNKCPHCGTEYRLFDYDWVIIDLKKS
ncbi:MAG: hypothetical protein II718_09120 [Clostridiales bacterium]|nr:hypothetical protein [Clostridiales bacterium]